MSASQGFLEKNTGKSNKKEKKKINEFFPFYWSLKNKAKDKLKLSVNVVNYMMPKSIYSH